MKLALAITIGVLTAAFVVLRLRQTLDALASLGDVIADSRRSWKVALLNLICFSSAGLLGVMLAASRPAWQIALVLVIGAVTFISAGLLSQRLRPSPIYSERYPENPRGEESNK